MKLGIKRLKPDAIIPKKQTPEAAGMDVHAYVEGPTVVRPHSIKLIKTGIALDIPKGYEVQVRSRSGLALKKAVMVLNSPGTIDSDYTGEVGVILANFGSEPFVVEKGDRIAQLVVSAVPDVEVVEVDVLEETERGSNGFGSTGV
jgi:dUTP pyrophosphatase